jgi:predicted RNA-binding protein with EMAP domain
MTRKTLKALSVRKIRPSLEDVFKVLTSQIETLRYSYTEVDGKIRDQEVLKEIEALREAKRIVAIYEKQMI